MSNLQQVIDAITAMDQRLTQNIDEIKQQNNTLIKEFNIIKTKFNVISDNQIQIKDDLTAVNIQVEMLKQQSLSAEIVINGIPDKLLGKEILIQTLNQIFKLIDCREINYWDYRSIFLMKKNSNTTDGVYTSMCATMQLYSQKFIDEKSKIERTYFTSTIGYNFTSFRYEKNYN